jgi:hypothetical protein
MRKAPLKLECANPRVTGTIMTFVGPSLMEAHYLLCAMPIRTSASGDAQPHTFPRPATAMILMAIAALSTIPYFDPAANGAPKKINGSKVPGDKDKFRACMLRYFPWGGVRGVDLDAERACLKVPLAEENAKAVDKLYSLLRNPMMHSGGAVGCGFPKLRFSSPFPGLGSVEENERALCEWCAQPDLRGQRFLTYDAISVTIDARTFYWATRRMIEKFAADPNAQADIVTRILNG